MGDDENIPYLFEPEHTNPDRLDNNIGEFKKDYNL